MIAVVAFIVVLGVLIVVHELGHFVTAKMARIAVPRFSIGLGPKVWGVKYGETEYVLSALPLGGYVKMAGMAEEEALEKLEGGPSELEVPPERRFDSKSLPVRAVVISAGVVMNFVFAIFAFAWIAHYQGIPIPLIGEVVEGSPAEAAGLRHGDLIIAADDQELDTWYDFVRYVRPRYDQDVALTVERSGQRLDLQSRIARIVETDSISGDSIVYGQIGVGHDSENGRRAIGAGTALAVGTRQSVNVAGLIVDFVGQLLTGRASARDLGGPILIGQLSGQAARAGPLTLINFMALLSVHLAVLNLLPIPILDGGHLVFLAIEAVQGRAVSLKARARWSQLGFILILALMVWVITSDVLRLTGN